MTSIGEGQIVDPLPQRYLTPEPGVGGVIKQRPEDFLVDEIPLYEPSGTGEHLYLGIEKANVSHGELLSCLRRFFNVREDAIGFAGMKDKLGVTRQTVSIHTPIDPPSLDLEHTRIKVLWAMRHANKLRLGHLAGNRFSIRIRNIETAKAPQALRTLRRLEQTGVPNYFGAQRFGYRRNNHIIGAAMLNGDWDGLLAHLLGTAGGAFPEYQRQRRELFDAGRYREAFDMWTPADRAERIACGVLARGKSAKDACFAVGKTTISFWISAFQSAIFNRVLDRRIDDGLLTSLVEGDLAWKHDTRAVFRVTAADLAGDDLPARLARLEISPSGPLWGAGMKQPEGEVLQIEREALEATGMTPQTLAASPLKPEGGRRPLRTPIRDAMVDAGVDEHGPYVRLAFDLPRGSYATVVLREIMKSDDAGMGDHGGESA